MTDQEGAAALVLLASPIRRKIVEVIRAAHRTRSAIWSSWSNPSLRLRAAMRPAVVG